MKQVPDLAIKGFDEVADWDSYVERHAKGTIFHSTSLIRTMAATKRHQPFAYAAIDKNQEICAILVAVKISTLGTWADPIAARSILYAEPIYSDTIQGICGIGELIMKHDEYMRCRTLFAEVRPFFAPPEIEDPLLEHEYELLEYRNYELNLQKPQETLFSQLDSKCRNSIRSSMRRGLAVREVNPTSELDRFYALVSESYRGSRVPLADRSLFESAFREMPPPVCRLFVAEYQNEIVAVACFLAHKKRVFYWTAGSKRISGIAATSCLMWEAIKKCSAEGFDLLDLAGAGWEGESYGPGKFKSQFGGILTNNGRYRRVYSPWKLRCASSAYRVLRGWLSPA